LLSRNREQQRDKLGDEIVMIDLALAESYARLQARGRDAGDIMRELKFTMGEANK
jgi:hypothetical protein